MNNKYTYLIIILLIVANFVAFGRIAGNDFICFDDTGYITDNYFIKSGINSKSIRWAFTAVVEKNWVPLTIISHMLDWKLFGANPSGHHIISLLLHIGSVIFLFLFLNKTTNNIWSSAFAAAFFALHPLRVESVAWASERKDVLSLFFGMASLYAYAFYVQKNNFYRYIICLFLFCLSLLSKSMMVTLPFVFLIIDYWPLGRWDNVLMEKKQVFHSAGRLIKEKTPFFLLSILLSIITFLAQYKAGTTYPSFLSRISNAVVAYVIYLGKTFRPVDLTLSYYHVDFRLWHILFSGFILIGITFVVLYTVRKWPFLFVGWFWFLGTLIPVIGIVPTNALVTDHYTYLPSIGIAIMLSWGGAFLFRRKKIRGTILFTFSAAILFSLAILTWIQCGYWKNSIELFRHAVMVTENNYMAHDKLGVAYKNKGEIARALYHHNQALLINPYYANAYNNRGIIYLKECQYQKALDDFNRAITLNLNFANAYNNRGVLYDYVNNNQLAIRDYSKAISLKKNFAEAYKNRACVYFKLGNLTSGCEDAKKACALKECQILEMVKAQGYCR